MMKSLTFEELSTEEKAFVNQALNVRENARAPFSGYKVGSIVISSNGKLYLGCNVETISYEVTHAERNAIDTMNSAGEREIAKIFIATKDGGPCCGACRQAIWEFANDNADLPIYLVDGNKNTKLTTIGELFPYPFPQASAEIS